MTYEYYISDQVYELLDWEYSFVRIKVKDLNGVDKVLDFADECWKKNQMSRGIDLYSLVFKAYEL